MKINIGKIASTLARILAAAPVVIAAVKPVVDAVKKHPTKPGG